MQNITYGTEDFVKNRKVVLEKEIEKQTNKSII